MNRRDKYRGNKTSMKKRKINYQLLIRRICLIILDILCIVAASILALMTRFEFDFYQIPPEFLKVNIIRVITMVNGP